MDFGAARRAPSEPVSAAFLTAGVASIVGLFAVVAAGVGSVMLGGAVTPFYYYDAMVVIAVALGPVAIVLIVMVVGNGAVLFNFASGLGKTANLICGLVFFLVLVPGNFILYANQSLDRSPAVAEIVRVEDAWVRTDRYNKHSFMVGVAPAVSSPLGSHSLYGQQPIRLDHAEWERVAPGRTSILLQTRTGFFGLPWYEPEPHIFAP